MPRNGNGTYVLPANSFNPAVSGGTIESTSWNATANDLAAALTQSLSNDGQTPMVGNLAMGNNKITGLAVGTNPTDAVNLSQITSLSGNYAVLSANIFVGAQTINSTLTVNGNTVLSGAAGLTVKTGSNTSTVTLFCQNDTGVSTGPNLILQRATGSVASGGLLGAMIFDGATSTSSVGSWPYAQIIGQITNPVAGSTRGAILFRTNDAAQSPTRMIIGRGLYSASASGGDLGEGTINVASGVYVNGTKITANSTVRVVGTYTANADLSTNIPADDSIPQKTEGTQIITINVVTTTATQRVSLSFQAFGSTDSSTYMTAALFQGSAADAVQVGTTWCGVNTWPQPLPLIIPTFDVLIGSATTTAFAVRVGAPTGNVRLNGLSNARLFGGAASATLIATVYEP